MNTCPSTYSFAPFLEAQGSDFFADDPDLSRILRHHGVTTDGPLARLSAFARWMHHHERSVRGCTQAPAEFTAPTDCRFTYNPTTRRLYVHVLVWPFQVLWLDGLGGKVEYAQFLHDGSEVEMKGLEPWQHDFGGDQKNPEKTLSLRLPILKPDVMVPVIELFLR